MYKTLRTLLAISFAILIQAQNLTASTSSGLLKVSSEQPTDVTHLIVNPGFESGFDGWTNNGMATQTNTVFPKTGTTYVEKWVNIGQRIPDVGIQQTLTNLTNGKYRLYVTAGNIQQTTSGSTTNRGNPQTGVWFFAGYYTEDINDIQERSLDFIVVNKRVAIGLKAENATGNWLTCDNFKLEYLGEYETADLAGLLSAQLAHAEKLSAKKIQNSIRETLENKIESAQQALDEDPLSADNLSAAYTALETVFSQVEASIKLYADLQSKIDYANQVLTWYANEPDKISNLTAARNEAVLASNNFDLTAAAIKQAATALNQATKAVDKQLYIPGWALGDVNNPDNNYSLERSRQSKNWVVFWEKGLGDNPGVNLDDVLRVADETFDFYADSLGFVVRGNSKSDTYKMIIRLLAKTDWEANGGGVDGTTGMCTFSSGSAIWSRNWQTLRHEIGHCFQGQAGADSGHGWNYGFGPDASGGNVFWENCAQWQAYKIMTNDQFTNEWYNGYLGMVHAHPLHEWARYENFFLPDFWCFKQDDMKFVGRMWLESKRPEDPIEAYKRLAGNMKQDQFNDEMWECAARFATWDIPHIKQQGANHFNSRPQPKLNDVGENYWLIDPSNCPENYGHNIIKLNGVFVNPKKVSVFFEGKAGIDGFRKNLLPNAGWRFGFVALTTDGTRVYSDIGSANYFTGTDTLHFETPAKCKSLWLVVSGAPRMHVKHAWDDDTSNDEQWPYQVKFNNTNLRGYRNVVETGVDQLAKENMLIYAVGNTLYAQDLPQNSTLNIFDITGRSILTQSFDGENNFSTNLPEGAYIINVMHSNGRYNQKVIIK